jgi:diaminopimelate decarboxylase
VSEPKLFSDTRTFQHLCERHGTPLYVYDEARIRARCRRLKHAFVGQPVKLLYAVKANDNPHVLRIIREEGFGLDTVSFEEALLGMAVGQQPSDIYYTENNMTDAEMRAAMEAGVYLNIGSYSRLAAFCEAGGRTCSIRVNPAIGDGHHAKVDTGNRDSKFGIRLDLIPQAVGMARSHGVRINGLHLHIGSGIRKPDNLIAAMRTLMMVGDSLPDLEFMNFGGGFPIPYRDGEEEFSIEEFAAKAAPILAMRPLTYCFEPGRWTVGPAGLLLTRVNTVKDQGRITFLGTDTGFNHLLRPALYEAWHEVMNVSRAHEPVGATYTVAGNICETGDILAEDRLLPETRIGDILALCDAGAYGMTMASHYNRRPLPAEVLIREDGRTELIRPRKTATQTITEYLNETGVTS